MSDMGPADRVPHGLQWALNLDGRGGVKDVADDLAQRLPGQGHTWIHVDGHGENLDDWLRRVGGLTAARAGALLAEETRPRLMPAESGGVLMILRAVNLNPGETPDDMVSIRLWVEGSHTISLRNRKLRTTYEIRDELLAGEGPRDAATLLENLVSGIVDKIEEALEALVERADDLEQAVSTGGGRTSHRRTLAELRNQIVTMHRHLAPQRVVLGKLSQHQAAWLPEPQRALLREHADRGTRLVEELDALRERGKVISDELNQIMAEALNERMYILSVAAGLFLPLSLIAGVMGANVGGVPLSEDPMGFYVLSVVLSLLGIAGYRMLMNVGWLGGPADE